jgi:hypothetical protein
MVGVSAVDSVWVLGFEQAIKVNKMASGNSLDWNK